MELEVALVARCRDFTRFDSPAHGTVWFVHVRTILELAAAEEWPKLGKTVVEIFGRHAPESDFSQTGRVHHVATARVGQRNEQRADGRVPSLVHRLADFTNAQGKLRVERVQERRLAHPRRPGKSRRLPGHGGVEPLEADTLFDARPVHGVARALIRRDQRLHERRFHEFDLIDHDARGDVVTLGNHQEPIEHPHMWLWLGGGEHHHDLVDVRGNNPFAARATRRTPGQLGASRMDRGDRPGRA